MGDSTAVSLQFPAAGQAASETLVGRHQEVEHLRALVNAAAAGGRRVALISGQAGAGKTSLSGELRKLALVRSGRYVTGKFGRLSASSAITQAFGALAGLLLAEPDAQLAQHRQHLVQTLGPYAGLACTVPEFKLLLGELPQPRILDPAHERARVGEVMLGILRGIASPARPVVMVLDDLHWGRSAAVHFIDNVLAAPDLAGLLLVGIYRDDELASEHPLSAAIARWHTEGSGVDFLRVSGLGDADMAVALSRMLGVPADAALPLAQALAPHAGGNPHHTVEMINALRREGVLLAHADGWHWRPDTLRQYLERTGVAELLETRLARLPSGARALLNVLACLRQETTLPMLRAACDVPDPRLEFELDILTDGGLILWEAGPPVQVRLRHDSVQDAALGALPERERQALHLLIARRLAAHAAFTGAAAGQYLAAADAIAEPAECDRAALLLREAAGRARVMADHALAQRMLAAALSLLRRAGAAGATDAQLQCSMEIDQHATLYSLGRFEEADAVYQSIVTRNLSPVRMVDAACVQLSTLLTRDRVSEAIALGVEFLRRLGTKVPERIKIADLQSDFARLRLWAATFDPRRELARPEAQDPLVIATAKMAERLCSAAYLIDAALACWIVLECQSIWERHGPCPSLLAPLMRTTAYAAALGDRRTGYVAGGHLLAFCEGRGWEPEGSHLRYLFAVNSIHWFEPLEQAQEAARRAREGLLAGGDLQGVCLTHRVINIAALECGPALDDFAREIDAVLEFAERTRKDEVAAAFLSDRQLLRCLRGETLEPGSFDDGEFSEWRHLADHAGNPMVIGAYHQRRAIASAIFGDALLLARHVRPMRQALLFRSSYSAAWLSWFEGLGAAWHLQDQPQGGTAASMAHIQLMDECLEFLDDRAADAPSNFRHLALHLRAERAWACGDVESAACGFGDAVRALDGLNRPWHAALITERAGRFQIARGRMREGRRLLLQARRRYGSWGASAKVAQLAARGRAGARAAAAGPSRAAKPDALDTLAVLRASQALGSERNISRLRIKVEEVLKNVTGATRAILALRDSDTNQWVVRESQDAVSADAERECEISGAGHLLPLSAFRCAERTRAPLLVADAVTDDRFARDAYLQGARHCSLMVVPVVHQGTVRAILVLENRASADAFSAARLDAVLVIAGQLAVSLESAQVYERLERKVADQTRQLREAQSRLLAEARRAGMAQIATNVLHNVGNVLTSVNVSTHMLETRVRESHSMRIRDLADLVATQLDRLGEVLGDQKAQLLPNYLRKLATELGDEREELLQELRRLGASVEHIKNVVAMQQSYAGGSCVLEAARAGELIDDALRIQEALLQRSGITVQRDFGRHDHAAIDKTRVMQILLNLLENARQATSGIQGERRLQVSVRQDHEWIAIGVSDNGCGIAADSLAKIFSHGFTTKQDGHGFGLHSCAIAAQEMGGRLAVHSDGPGLGSTFTLHLPIVPADRAGD